MAIEHYTSGEKALTQDEYKKILDIIDSVHDEALLRTAVSTGMRREDIVHIRVANVDLENNCITFHEKKKRRDKTVYISDELRNLLRKYINAIPKKQEYLFPISSRTAWNILNRYCERAAIPKRPFHSLRATCIKFAQANGWSAEQTARHIGDTITTIQRHYSTPSNAEMQEVAKKKGIS